MKNFDLNKFKFNISFLKKYDYDINEIIGVKDSDKFVLYADKKLIRIYRDSLKSKALLASYVPIEKAIFYSFEVEKSVLEKVNLDEFIETKVYEEAGVDETEKYIIKYKVIKSLKDEKSVIIEVIIVSAGFIQNGYKSILEESGYIDYISFPAFAYEALYHENIIKKANDLFVVFLYDKVFLTFYSEGELLSIVTISGGLEKVYESLKKLKIKNFDKNMFEKILTKKGVSALKYSKAEEVVLNEIKEEFMSLVNIIDTQINNLGSKYNINEIERIFVTSEFGNIEGLQGFIQNVINTETLGFEFYEDYNLDRLNVNPFLFLGMLEAHNAYKFNQQKYNFSLFLRKPTFFYRPSGRLLSVFAASVIIMGAYPAYLYLKGAELKKNNEILNKKIQHLTISNIKLNVKVKKLNMLKNKIKKDNDKYTKNITFNKNLIKSVYEFKYSYMPKSKELTDITLLMNKNDVYLKKLNYKDGVFIIDVYSFKEMQIPDLLDDLVKKGFNIDTDGLSYKNNRYHSIIRITE